MKLLIESYISIFIITLSILICSSFITAEMDMNNARDFHASCVALIETTDFDEEIISNCIKEAKDRGYTLDVAEIKPSQFVCSDCGIFYDSNLYSCPNCNSTNIDSYSMSRLYSVELEYSINIKILGISKIGLINGYAR